ncbi:MAG TPA: winged helix-turn-helix transcriptional regulator [Solirubrobacterales bacterium]
MAVALLSSPLNVHILQALETEALSPIDLRRAVNSPPQSTMRVYIRKLTDLNVLERRRYDGFPPTVDYALTPTGKALRKVGDALQAWLDVAPEGPVVLGTPGSKSAARALVDGWSTNIIRALAARPYSLTELSRLDVHTSYPALERRLSAMRLVNQVEPAPGDGRGTPYRATEWLRKSVHPLIAATAWERKYLPEATKRIGRLDVEAAFLLAVPLMELPPDLSGRVRLAVEVQGGSSPAHAGALLEIAKGKVESCSVRLGGNADASVSGTAMGWLRQMNGHVSRRFVEFSGDQALGEAITTSLRATGLEAPLALEGPSG